MRNTTPLLLAAALIVAAPAAAQDNAMTNGAVAADPMAMPDANMMATDPAMTNGMVTDPAMTTADPMATDPMATDPALAVPAQEDDDGFPWGILGLLGLAGLIPRKRSTDTDNRTDRVNR